MKIPAVRTILVWGAMAALCMAGTVYEYPHAVDSLWYLRNVFVSWDAGVTTLVPDRVAERDPEAGAVLRYVLEFHPADPNTVAELRSLIDQHPRNEFFLSQLAEALALGKHADPNEALPIASQLVAVSPSNAYAHYLRAWLLLQTPTAGDDEVLREFQEADRLTEFHLPYGKYQQRVMQLAEAIVLPARRRPHVHSYLQTDLGWDIQKTAEREDIDRPWSRQVLASAAQLADRTIDAAYDLESLQAGAQLLEEVEKAKLSGLALTDAEAWQARRRLGRAAAINGLRNPPSSDLSPLGAEMPIIVTWGCVALLAGIAIMAIRLRRQPEPPDTHLPAIQYAPWLPMHLQPGHGLRSIPGAFILAGLLMILLLHRWSASRLWVSLLVLPPWVMMWFSWIWYPDGLLRVSLLDVDLERRPWRGKVAYVVLWLNGMLLLLMSNSEFFAAGRVTGWSRSFGVFVIWSLFCIFLGLSLLSPGPSSKQRRRNLAWAAAIGWALTLIGFDVVGAQCRQENQAWANLSFDHSEIPPATQQTYERFIRDGGPPSYIDDEKKADALPAYLEYFAPGDMEAFLGRWRAEGKTIDELQRWGLLKRSARDVRPIIRRVLAEWDIAGPS